MKGFKRGDRSYETERRFGDGGDQEKREGLLFSW